MVVTTTRISLSVWCLSPQDEIFVCHNYSLGLFSFCFCKDHNKTIVRCAKKIGEPRKVTDVHLSCEDRTIGHFDVHLLKLTSHANSFSIPPSFYENLSSSDPTKHKTRSLFCDTGSLIDTSKLCSYRVTFIFLRVKYRRLTR